MTEIHKSASAFPRVGILLLSLILWFSRVSISNGFVSRNPSKHRYNAKNNDLALRGWFMDDKASTPKVQKPENFVVPEPKPLTISASTDIGRFTRNSVAFVFRLGVGAFVLGWKIDTLFYKNNDDETKKYSLALGPFSIRDSSSVLSTGDVPRPELPLILYEYDASPYCKRVREFINLLDLTVEYRPCPGARQGKFSDELFEKTGRRTVRCVCVCVCVCVFVCVCVCVCVWNNHCVLCRLLSPFVSLVNQKMLFLSLLLELFFAFFVFFPNTGSIFI
jgi:hypothetical protein